MRYQLRNKIAKQDYVDKDLKNYHYSNSMVKMQSAISASQAQQQQILAQQE
jgi:hypothetical protein